MSAVAVALLVAISMFGIVFGIFYIINKM